MRMQEQNKAVTMKGRSFHPVVVVDVVGNEQAGETIQKGETLESAWIACSPDLNHLGKNSETKEFSSLLMYDLFAVPSVCALVRWLGRRVPTWQTC